jgi:hypothetical protein
VSKSPPRSPKANAVCGASHRHDSARVPGLADPPVRIAFAVHSEILDSALQHRASGYGAGSGCSRSAASPSRSSNTAQFTPSLWRIVITNTSSRPPVRDSIFADHRHGTGMAGSGQVLFQSGRQVLADRGASRHSQFATAIRVSLNNQRNSGTLASDVAARLLRVQFTRQAKSEEQAPCEERLPLRTRRRGRASQSKEVTRRQPRTLQYFKN